MEAAIILWILCGVICFFIVKEKGYPRNECYGNAVGGFLGGVIWLIICLCKKPYQDSNNVNKSTLDFAENKIAGENAVEQLGKLAQLRDSGAISTAEFDEKKKELLKRI